MAGSGMSISRTDRKKKLKKEDIRDRLVTQDELLDHLDVTVFKPNGVNLDRSNLKSIIDGVTRELCYICLCGASAKLGILGTFLVTVSDEAKTKLPHMGDEESPVRTARFSFRSSRSVKRMLKDAEVCQEG